jgi:carboxyl-terminal processing protease
MEKSSVKKSGWFLVPLLALAAAFFLSGAYMRRHVARAEGPRGILWAGLSRPFTGGEGTAEPEEVFEAVLNSLKSDYVDKITDQKKLTYGAIEAMVDSLHDPYSQFLTPERRKVVEEAEKGVFHGLGAIVLLQRTKFKTLSYEHLVIANVLEGSPAEKAGIKPGDAVVKVNGQYFLQIPEDVILDDIDQDIVRELLPMKEGDERPILTYKEAMALLNGDGKTLTLTVQRAGQDKPEDIKVTLGPTPSPAVVSRMIEPGVGYLAVRGFIQGSHSEVEKGLKGLTEGGAKSLILDLRDNFGGPLTEAEEIAGYFTEGPLGYVTHQKSGKQPLKVTGKKLFDGRIVVLVNHATLGTGELLAAALEDQAKAPLVGESTFGDGLDQSLIPLSDGSAIQLTTGKFTSPSGQDYNLKGLKPTNPVAGPPQNQLDAALALAKGKASGGV